MTRGQRVTPALPGGQRAQAIPANIPCPGNASTFRETVVQTIDRVSGQIVCQETLKGAPFIMRSDIIVAKRVIRMASKLGRTKGLRHTVKQSVTSKLKEAIEQQALSQVLNHQHHALECK